MPKPPAGAFFTEHSVAQREYQFSRNASAIATDKLAAAVVL
jgi:hypothetical protein